MRMPDRLLRQSARALRSLPAWMVDALNRHPVTNARGVRLDPHLQLLIRLEERLVGLARKTTPAQARVDMARSARLASLPPRSVEVTDDRSPSGRRRRRYHPGGQALPMLVYLHGGGWVVGDLDSHDSVCRRIAADAGVIVVAIDYLLAPEHLCPLPIDDALQAFVEVRAQASELGGDPDAVGIGGDSAGGHLSALICSRLRSAGQPQPAVQLLLYPALDLSRQSPSQTTFASGFLLTGSDLDWFLAQFGCPDPTDPEVSPHFQVDLRGLAPAIVVTAGFDPLRDEGERHAQRLLAAGVPVVHLHEAALVHGFLHLDGAIAEADRAFGRITAALQRVLGAGAPGSSR